MQKFTAKEYLFIDLANHFGLDKETFEVRIQWVEDNLDDLESLMDQADDPILYIKTVMAIRDGQKGIPSGHPIAFDSCASGLQVMGTLMNCKKTCNLVGLIDPNRRADAYTDVTKLMSKRLGTQVTVARSEVKPALMTHFYGSRMKPLEIFGEDTPELHAFYETLEEEAPGASELMRILLGTWQPYATTHDWVMPDGFHVKCPVLVPVDVKIEVDELDHSTFTHRFYENEGTEKGLSNAANATHAIDGMVVREINRRCNYDPNTVNKAKKLIEANINYSAKPEVEKFTSFKEVELINETNISNYSQGQLRRILDLVNRTLEHKPFHVICVHDA